MDGLLVALGMVTLLVFLGVVAARFGGESRDGFVDSCDRCAAW